MCTIISKDQFIGKNYDSAYDGGMVFTNKKGLIKKAAVFPPDLPLEWVSSFGSITFSQTGKEIPTSGINENGLVAEQTTLLSSVYPETEGKPKASSLEAVQYLLDTCGNVEQALAALDRIAITSSSWPVHFALFDSGGDTAVVEFLQGEKKVCREAGSIGADKGLMLDNDEYRNGKALTGRRAAEYLSTEQCGAAECLAPEEFPTAEDMFTRLEKARRPDTVWSTVYDLQEKKIYLRRTKDPETVVIELDRIDFSPCSAGKMLDIKEGDGSLQPYAEAANLRLISGFFNHPVISGIMNLPDPEAIIHFIAAQSKSYDMTNEIVLRFLDGERIKQIPVKKAYKLYVLKYLASKFEAGREYTEVQVNAIIDEWHTFGDYFVLRRELIDSGLMKRLPNGSKYWRD